MVGEEPARKQDAVSTQSPIRFSCSKRSTASCSVRPAMRSCTKPGMPKRGCSATRRARSRSWAASNLLKEIASRRKLASWAVSEGGPGISAPGGTGAWDWRRRRLRAWARPPRPELAALFDGFAK